MRSYEVVLIDCYEGEGPKEFSGNHYDPRLYTHLVQIESNADPKTLKEQVLAHKAEWNLVISNSVRNKLSPGTEISHFLECHHFLFEHLGCFAEKDFLIESDLLEKMATLDQIIVPSPILKESFLRHFSDEKIHINYLRPIPDYFKALTKKPSHRNNTIVYAGKFIEFKGIMDFIKKNRELFEENKISLITVGSGSQDKELREYSQKYPFLKVLPALTPLQLLPLIDTALAVVVPSLLESYSMIVVEALLRGTPVLCHRTGIAKSLEGKVPGLFFLKADQTVASSDLSDITHFQDRVKMSKLMKMLLALEGRVLYELIRKDYEQH
jgi:glycosyltransferase involved in cell wall biosynthesis